MRGLFLTGVFLLIGSLPLFSQLVLTNDGKSDYTIVIGSDASENEIRAADELRLFLFHISDVVIPVVTDNEKLHYKEIMIGNNSHLDSISATIDFKSLEEDGYVIKIFNDHLILAGGSGKGVLYSVYTLLENYLGCRFYTPEDLILPKNPTIKLEAIDETYVPPIKMRSLYFPSMQDQAFCDWHKINSRKDDRKEWGMWVHTFDDLIPPKKYYDDHPEFFSQLGGERIPNGQLCLSNTEMRDTLIQALKLKIAEKPEAQYWSVSQNDNFLECECEKCRELNNKYGGASGTMIWFVNQVANEFPDKTISALAYQYTRAAPKQIKPLDNVNIMLCTIECNRSKAISEDKSSKSFRKDLKNWSKLTDDILIWDYTVQFRNYISPFPNLRVLQPNIQYFSGQGVDKMFQQGSGKSFSEFVELRSYIIAKLLWDPDIDVDKVIDDFIEGYYGVTAPFIRRYIDLLHDNLIESGDGLSIYGYPLSASETYLGAENMKKYFEIFEEARESDLSDPRFFKRFILAKLPLDFAMLDISLCQQDDYFGFFTETDGEIKEKPYMRKLLYDFNRYTVKAGIERLQEHGTSPDDFMIRIEEFLQNSYQPNLAYGKEIIQISDFSTKYNRVGKNALLDGLIGLNDYNYNWLGFEGEHLDMIIDLGEEKEVHKIETAFLQFHNAWIFSPEYVEFFVSKDGKGYESIGKVEYNTKEYKSGAFINSFESDQIAKIGRYIKIHAESLLTCPGWHIGSGKPCWIFTDEIIVN